MSLHAAWLRMFMRGRQFAVLRSLCLQVAVLSDAAYVMFERLPVQRASLCAVLQLLQAVCFAQQACVICKTAWCLKPACPAG
jgi:hypothetical protein